jgi:hypothetical protein
MGAQPYAEDGARCTRLQPPCETRINNASSHERAGANSGDGMRVSRAMFQMTALRVDFSLWLARLVSRLELIRVT